MTISLRSVKRLIADSKPMMPISDKSVILLRDYLEQTGKRVVIYASRIQEEENRMRTQIGDRQRKRLSKRSLQLAIENKYPGVMTRNDDSKD